MSRFRILAKPWTTRARRRGLATALFVAAAMASCTSDSSFRLREGWEEMPLCPPQSEPVVVSDLHLDQFSTCNLGGQQIRFPTGDIIDVPDVGTTGGHVTDDYILSILNLGLDGIFASYTDKSETRLWGTPSTIDWALSNPAAWHDRP